MAETIREIGPWARRVDPRVAEERDEERPEAALERLLPDEVRPFLLAGEVRDRARAGAGDRVAMRATIA